MSTYLKSLSTTAGFLEDCPVEFAEGLTCIIGARGTCKSTLVECVRFAFDNDTERVKILLDEGRKDDTDPSTKGLIRHTLGNGAARCELDTAHGTDRVTLTVEREAESDPRIYRDGVREYTNTDALHRIEIYSQGDLQRIADDDRHRLELIDRPNALTILSLKQNRQEQADELRRLGPQIRELNAQIEGCRQELKPAPEVEAQFAQVQKDRPELSRELETERAFFQKRSACLTALAEVVSLKNQIAEYVSGAQCYLDPLASAGIRLKQQEQSETEAAAGMLNVIQQSIASILQIGESIRNSEIEQELGRIEQIFEKLNDRYYQLRQQEQEANDSLKKEEILRGQMDHMESVKVKMTELAEVRKSLLEKRRVCRSKIVALSDEILDLRMAEVNAINEEHGDVVLLALEAGSQSKEYISQLSNLLSGSRIRAQEEVAADLASKISPTKLIDIVESGDAQQLAALLDRDLGQMARVVAHLADHVELYELEASIPDDRLDITMYDNGMPKPVSTLSKGQKATALLPLILRPLPYPLILDQPEDDLDNSFIYKSLVQTVLTLKKQRQLVFVTHNANIPVLGDADLVLVMSMKTPESANPAVSGSVDERRQDILDLMEGGAAAFVQRGQHYSDLLALSGETQA